MGVYIKGMEMPKNCEECEFCQLGLNAEWCYITELAIPENCITGENRQTDCPLIELPPHGRLVDADAMQMQWFNLNFDRKITDGTLAYWNFQLSKMPTILEAEVEE